MTDKEKQLELKKVYFDEMLPVWNGDVKMAAFCTNRVARFIELSSGIILVLDKRRIQKDFWFGYSDSQYDTEDMDRATRVAEEAMKNQQYFIEQNMKELNSTLEELEKAAAGNQGYKVYMMVNYSGSPDNTKAYSWTVSRNEEWIVKRYFGSGHELTTASQEDCVTILEAYKLYAQAFRKRLDTYLKKYGMSHVHADTYWQDR